MKHANIQAIYWTHTPDHKKPVRPKSEAATNKGVKGSSRDKSGAYAVAQSGTARFRNKVLPKLEAARRNGDIVRFSGRNWLINGAPLAL